MTREESFTRAFEEQKNTLAVKQKLYDEQIAALKSEDSRFGEIEARLSAIGVKAAVSAISGDRGELNSLKCEQQALFEERRDILRLSGVKGISYDCEICRDTGYVGGKICECIKHRAQAIMLESLSKDLPLENSRFENFDLNYYSDPAALKKMTEIFKLCREYALGFNSGTVQNLLFMGETGLGKTHLSLAIVYEVLCRGFNVIYGSAYNLFSVMETEHFEKHINHSYDAAVGCDLLVIDDLGGEFISPYIQSLVYNIINTRGMAGRPTIISTNLSIAEIGDRYTPRVASRFIGGYTAKKFFGSDVRQIKAMEKR